MATRNKKKLAALNKEKCEEHPRSTLAQNSNVPRSHEDYITQVSGEIEGRVTKKLSQEFNRTENRILGALARLDDFLMNPLIQGHSGTAPETSRNVFSINQGTNEDDSQSNPHPEAGLFNNQMTQNSGPEDGHDTILFSYYGQFMTFMQPDITISDLIFICCFLYSSQPGNQFNYSVSLHVSRLQASCTDIFSAFIPIQTFTPSTSSTKV